MLNATLSDKLDHLRQIFNESSRVLVAYSGGIDSTLVAKVAFDVLGDRALAITANSPSTRRSCCGSSTSGIYGTQTSNRPNR
jgi:uncharacterized protein